MSRGGSTAGCESICPGNSLAQDAAWVRADIPLAPREAFLFLADIERLFRLNPHLDISAWREMADRPATWKFNVWNETNGCRYDAMMTMSDVRKDRGFALNYDDGIKASSEFRIDPAGGGSTLTITEHYHPVRNPDDERLKDVDRSLAPWLASIRAHIAGIARYGWLPGYRWWTERCMLTMPLRQRRITRMIVWVSLLEFIVFLFVAAIFWLEQQRG